MRLDRLRVGGQEVIVRGKPRFALEPSLRGCVKKDQPEGSAEGLRQALEIDRMAEAIDRRTPRAVQLSDQTRVQFSLPPSRHDLPAKFLERLSAR